MKVTLESTTKIVKLNSIPCRIWQGRTEAGVECHAYISRIAVDKDADTAQFETELQEQAAPRPELEAIPMRMIL